MNDTCKTCQFWQPNITHKPEAFNGECHIRAPQVVADADGGAPRTAWPYTVHIDWCGEFTPQSKNDAKLAGRERHNGLQGLVNSIIKQSGECGQAIAALHRLDEQIDALLSIASEMQVEAIRQQQADIDNPTD